MNSVLKKSIPISVFIIILVMVFAGFNVSADSTSYPVINSELEPNNTQISANIVPVGHAVSGVLSSKTDVDYYKVTAVENGELLFYFENNSSKRAAWDIAIYSMPDEIPVGSTSSEIPINQKRTIARVNATGGQEYIVRVQPIMFGSEVLDSSSINSSYILSTIGHNLKQVSRHEATCTEDGNIRYWTCSLCKKNFADEFGAVEITDNNDLILTAKGHTEGSIQTENVVPATCVQGGSYENAVYCTVCGELLSRETEYTNKLGHQMTHYNEVLPTLEQTGNSEFWECSRCGKYFSDEEGNNEISDNSWILPKLLPESGDALIQMLEDDSEFVWFTGRYAWTPLMATGLSYDTTDENSILQMIIQWPDIMGLSDYYPWAVGDQIGSFAGAYYGPAIDEQGLRAYAINFFNISDSALDDFILECKKSSYVYYSSGKIAAPISGWGAYDVILCGIQSAQRSDNIYTIDLYGRVPYNYTQSGFSWGKTLSELDPAFTCTYRAVMEKKEANGQYWWSLHSIECIPPKGVKSIIVCKLPLGIAP